MCRGGWDKGSKALRTTLHFGALLLAATWLADTAPASARDLLGLGGLFGGASQPAGTLGYTASLNVHGSDDSTLQDTIAGVTRLMVEQAQGASDAYTLVARARGDIAQIQAALYSEAYYAGTIDIRIAGQPLDGLDPATLPVTDAAGPAVEINVTSGPRFRFGEIVVAHGASSGEAPAVGADAVGLVRGEMARSSLIVSASEKLVEAWRATGYPLAQIVKQDVAADHARTMVDVRIDIDPGPPAVYGWVGVSGARMLEHDAIIDQSKLTPGHAFRPRDLKRARDRIAKMPSVESVRIVEGRALDANGGLPVHLEVTERKPRYFGATTSLSTTDGAEVEAHWGHRNLFGSGEHLRVEGAVSRIGSEALSQLEFKAATIYTKPGVFDVDTDLVGEMRLTREHPDAYESLDATAKVGLARAFTPALSGSAAIAARYSRVEDAFGDNDYALISLPLEAAYDTRDNRMDASRGVFITGGLSPTVDALGGSAFVKSEIRAATYHALDAEARAILAGRVSAGFIAGASLADVPASMRFFAGGGGSVRGYEYRSLGPELGGQVVGGLGYVAGTAELRLRVTNTFGIVPFVDAAAVSDDVWAGASDVVYVGAGIGLRYHTALGPIRVDVAAPLTDRDGQSPVAVYVGLGQSF